MIVTSRTPRRHTIRIVNDTFTLYNEHEDGFADPINVRAYSEWNPAGLTRKYGLGTQYKGLLVIDGTEKYVDTPEDGFFTVKVGDKVAPYQTSDPIDDLLERGERLYTVMGVTAFVIGGALFSVEVVLG